MNFEISDIGQRFNFEIWPAQLIGTRFNNVTYLGSVDASGVTQFEPRSKHIAVYPTLPSGTPDRYDGYIYHRFRLPNGLVTFVGDPWIKVNTLVKLDNIRIEIRVGSVSAADADNIKQMFLNNGYDDVEVEIITL